MIRNYLKIAFRSLLRNKSNTLINISGLSVGLASSILIMMFIWHEMSYDNFHPDADNTYRVYCDQPGNLFLSSSKFNVMPIPFQPEVKERYPEVKYASRLTTVMKLMTLDHISYTNESFYAVDQDFLYMFDVQMIYGQKEEALTDPYSVLLSKTVSEKYFGNRNPLGEIMFIDDSLSFVVKGVFEDVASNSHFEYDMLMSFSYVVSTRDNEVNSWTSSSVKTYLQLADGTSPNVFEAKLKDLIIEKRETENEKVEDRYYLQNVQDIHLYGKINFEISSNGDIKYILIFGSIALFLLLIAAFNYMNLATARSLKRAREVGIRKVVGANQKQLFQQFIGESLLVTFISLLIALVLIEIFGSYFYEFVDREISFYSLDPIFYLIVITVIIAIAFFSGSYPAVYLSRFSPVKVLKGTVKGSSKSVLFRNSVVVLQFVISVALIICTLVVIKQLSFIKNKDLGFDTDDIIYFKLNSKELLDKKEVLKNELLSYPGITDVTTSDYLPSNIQNQSGLQFEGKEKKEFILAYFARVDYNFVDFYKIPLVAGENFNSEMVSGDFVIINEEVAKSMGDEDVIGKTILSGWPKKIPYTIVGVVKNFHFAPLSQEIQPAGLKLDPENCRRMSVKVNDGMLNESLTFIESKVSEISSKYPFEYQLINETIDSSYSEERRLSSLFIFFTVVAVVIACLGLFGLISYITDQRTKEIGIRKVLGASVHSILKLLSNNITRWVLIANVIAWPIAWYFMDRWLQNFVYRIELNVGVFILAGMLIFLIAILTAGFQSLKAALMNPVESLKCE